MERKVGTISRGIRCPIIREGDDLVKIVTDSVLEAAEAEGFEIRDRDVIAVTESVVARSQGNYASVEAIAEDVRAKLGGDTIGVIFPILSRNRFAICLRGIAMGAKKVVLMLSYPSDEVGNELVSLDQLDEAGINPYSDVLTLEKYRELFGENKHPFTGVDYVAYYGDLIKEAGAEVEIIFANDCRSILPYTKKVLNCDIHTRVRTKRLLKAAGAEVVIGMDDILTSPVNGSGCNEKYGLLGSNKSTEDTIKLFPRKCTDLVMDIQKEIFAIDEECRIVLNHLVSALNIAAQSKQLIDEKLNLQQININNERLISIKQSQIINQKEALTPQEQTYYNEIFSILENVKQNNQRIAEIDVLTRNNLKVIGEEINQAQVKAAQIDNKLKIQLYYLIQKYFSIYNSYIKEVVFDIQMNGKKINGGCAKLDFEKNHPKK